MLQRLFPHEVIPLRATQAFKRSILLACFASCSDPVAVSDQSSAGVVRFIVSNQLAAPVTIAVDDTFALILFSGASSGLAVSPSAQWLTWTSAKPTDTTGTPIADEIGAVRLRVSGIRSTLEITNVINDTTYVTAGVFNPTNARVSVGVYDGSTVACAGVLRATTGGVIGFTKIGYYRLLPRTEIRAYRDEFSCTGPYVAWPTSQLTQFTPKSGLVTLTLPSAP
ncbi:MAG: hypothetical protein JWM95_2251 [Gemmatimonadetes bacterium]|nr:hypothetical protein [Gemmatimonadota bacterium]